MALYTGKGDDGTTTTFSCDQRLSKSSKIAEALGVMDEASSVLGICKALSQKNSFKFQEAFASDILHQAQEGMFIIQAELAGADKTISEDKVKWMENMIDEIEAELPEIKTFFIPGASELSAFLDWGRTVVRRAERRVVAVNDEGIQKLGKHSLAYINRLSSLMYALVRLANKEEGAEESAPSYK